MVTFLVAAALCLPPVLVNKTKYKWNAFDRETIARAGVRCGQIYPDSPCVKLFIKFGKQDYNVVCGNK